MGERKGETGRERGGGEGGRENGREKLQGEMGMRQKRDGINYCFLHSPY